MFMERDEPGFRPEFLPLTFLTKILLDVEDRGIYSENASFVSTSETSLLNSQAKLCVYCVCSVWGSDGNRGVEEGCCQDSESIPSLHVLHETGAPQRALVHDSCLSLLSSLRLTSDQNPPQPSLRPPRSL